MLPASGIGETLGNYPETEMERLEPYKGFQIRAYQEWSGQWLAEARKAGISKFDHSNVRFHASYYRQESETR